MSSFTAIKAQTEAKQNEERRDQERRRNLLFLIIRHLVDSGYLDSADKLQAESGQSLTKFEIADNIDLLSILQEFEEYYEIKYNRKPKLIRKIPVEDRERKPSLPPGGRRAESPRRGILPQIKASPNSPAQPRPPDSQEHPTDGDERGRAGRHKASSAPASRKGKLTREPSMNMEAQPQLDAVNGSQMEVKGAQFGVNAQKARNSSEDEDFFEHRLLKPPPDYGSNHELRELASLIQRDITVENPRVRWTDVIGLDDCKRLLKEAVVMPVKFPQFFTGVLQPWRGILLHGPPGTGKTMLAKAVATECRTTFFNVSAATIVSKWRGESEKLVRVLFELARHHAPSTVFLDEIDALMMQRGTGDEHEGSRRLKTELLIQMDGLAKSNELVFVLAASNLPWELDQALLRRLEKRILVPLPDPIARSMLLRQLLTPDRTAPNVDFETLARRTEGYSGADCVLVCKEAAMRPLRRLMQIIEQEKDLPPGMQLSPITSEDVDAALCSTKPAARLHGPKYVEFQAEHGSV